MIFTLNSINSFYDQLVNVAERKNKPSQSGKMNWNLRRTKQKLG